MKKNRQPNNPKSHDMQRGRTRRRGGKQKALRKAAARLRDAKAAKSFESKAARYDAHAAALSASGGASDGASGGASSSDAQRNTGTCPDPPKILSKFVVPCYFQQQREERGREVFPMESVLVRNKQTIRSMHCGSTTCQVVSEPKNPSYDGEGDVYNVTVHWRHDGEVDWINVQRFLDPKSAERSYRVDLVHTTAREILDCKIVAESKLYYY